VEIDTSRAHAEEARDGESAANEADFLARQSALARSAISGTLVQAGHGLKQAVDPRTWTRRYPWASMGVAAVMGGAAATLVVLRTRRPDPETCDTHERWRKRPAKRAGQQPTRRKPSRPGITSRLARAGISTVISTVSGGILAAMTAKPKSKRVAPLRTVETA